MYRAASVVCKPAASASTQNLNERPVSRSGKAGVKVRFWVLIAFSKVCFENASCSRNSAYAVQLREKAIGNGFWENGRLREP